MTRGFTTARPRDMLIVLPVTESIASYPACLHGRLRSRGTRPPSRRVGGCDPRRRRAVEGCAANGADALATAAAEADSYRDAVTPERSVTPAMDRRPTTLPSTYEVFDVTDEPSAPEPTAGLNAAALRRLVMAVAILVVCVVVLAFGFKLLMAAEGRDFGWASSLYWTVVTMSTLGYGDIVFESELGRLYSVAVLGLGALLFLALLPFMLIQFVYVPWVRSIRRSRTPRSLPPQTAGHLILVGRGPLQDGLMRRGRASRRSCVVLLDDLQEAMQLRELGYPVVVGPLDDPQTYRRIRAETASMVFTAGKDTTNTNVAFTMREVAASTPLVSTASSPDAADILGLAGCDEVLQPGELLGEQFARRILAPAAHSTVIANLGGIAIAQVSAAGTGLVGRRLGDIVAPDGLTVKLLGLWDRGTFRRSDPTVRVEESSILLLAGTLDALAVYDRELERFLGTTTTQDAELVLILGAGRVGQAAARRLRAAGTRCRLVERAPEHATGNDPDLVVGDAADRSVLRRAGIDEATTVIVTTHDDDMNVYLTLFCRRLRPDLDILGRVNDERNVSTMHRAGADIALSYASTGAAAVWNVLHADSTQLLTEGLVVLRLPMPADLRHRRLHEVELPPDGLCEIVAVVRDGHLDLDTHPDTRLLPGDELLVLADTKTEQRLLRLYRSSPHRSRLRTDPRPLPPSGDPSARKSLEHQGVHR